MLCSVQLPFMCKNEKYSKNKARHWQKVMKEMNKRDNKKVKRVLRDFLPVTVMSAGLIFA